MLLDYKRFGKPNHEMITILTSPNGRFSVWLATYQWDIHVDIYIYIHTHLGLNLKMEVS